MKIMYLFSVIFLTICQAQAGQHFSKVVWIVFENTNYETALKQSDFAKLASKGALFTNLHAALHPSQGNYIAMVAGSTLGVKSDQNVDLNFTHIGDLLENAGLDWRVYAEGYPGNCFKGAFSGDYARKHNPFISFKNVSGDATRCKKIESSQNFLRDYADNNLPAYTMYIPNQKNDGHNTNVEFAGKWLSATMGAILANPQSLGDTLFVITFDEAKYLSTNQIYTVVLGSKVKMGAQNKQNISHPALLRMIEDEFNLGTLGRQDASAEIITGIWN